MNYSNAIGVRLAYQVDGHDDAPIIAITRTAYVH